MKISYAARSLPKSGAVAVAVLQDRTLTPAAEELDKATGGAVRRALNAGGRFEGRKKQILEILAPAQVDNSRLILFGLGKSDELSELDVEAAGGEVLARLNALGETQATVVLDTLPGSPVDAVEMAARMGFGARLRAYRFDKYKTREKAEDKPTLEKLTIAVDNEGKARKRFDTLDKVADGVFMTRDLVSEPANVLYPESLAEECAKLEKLGVEVEILDAKQMKKLGMGALLAVAQGSTREPRLVAMRWNGGKGKKTPLAIVGKGVCFDSGGISIKPAAGMEDMKWDMGGAGVTIGLMKALAGRKAKVNAVGVVGLVENMPSGAAYRPGDILTSMSGQTIEVLNTDAEGRLVLADALWYAQKTYEPETVIDLATLTGAIIVSLGSITAGVFSNDDELAESLTTAGKSVAEPLWRMPLGEDYDRDINTDAADMKNTGEGRSASSIVAAQFLQRFIQKDVKWAHLDIAGVTWSKKDKPTVPKGGTAFGVRLLDRLIADRYEG
jgi:leucyl aminopeptidase